MYQEKLLQNQKEKIIIPIGFLLAFFTLFEDYWASKWIIIMMVCVFYYSIYVGMRTHYSFGFAIFYILLKPVILSSTIRISPVNDFFALNWAMAFSSLCIVLFSFILVQIDDYKLLFRCFAFACLANSLMIIGQKLCGFPGYGFLGEPSLGGCMIGITYPLLLNFKRVWKVLWVIPIIAISLLPGSTTPWAVMGVGTAIYLWVKYDKCRWALFFFCLVAFVALGYFSNGDGFFRDGNRFETQLIGLTWWWNHGDIWLGNGNGSFLADCIRAIGPVKGEDAFWLHMHSDLLKLLIEQGVIGLIMWGFCAFYAIKRAWGKPYLMGSLGAVLFFAIVQYPSHWPITAFICSAVFIVALKGGSNEYKRIYSKANRYN